MTLPNTRTSNASVYVRQFHEVFGVAIAAEDTTLLRDLRSSLLREEALELDAELLRPPGDDNLEEIAKELADLVYVAYGTALSLGIYLDQAIAQVHQSNMSKLVDGKPVKRADGKVLKGPNYQPPDMSGCVPRRAA